MSEITTDMCGWTVILRGPFEEYRKENKMIIIEKNLEHLSAYVTFKSDSTIEISQHLMAGSFEIDFENKTLLCKLRDYEEMYTDSLQQD
jgi:hypothetical protein